MSLLFKLLDFQRYIYSGMYIYIYIYCVFLLMSAVDSIFSIVILHICMSLFESTLLIFCKLQSKLDLPNRRQGSRERSNFDWGLQKLSIYIFHCMLKYIYFYTVKYFLEPGDIIFKCDVLFL